MTKKNGILLHSLGCINDKKNVKGPKKTKKEGEERERTKEKQERRLKEEEKDVRGHKNLKQWTSYIKQKY